MTELAIVARWGEMIWPPFSARKRRALPPTGLNVARLVRSILLPAVLATTSTPPLVIEVTPLRLTVPPLSATTDVLKKPFVEAENDVTPDKFRLVPESSASSNVVMLDEYDVSVDRFKTLPVLATR